MADYSGTITLGGTAQVAAAADANRATIYIASPQDEDMWVSFGGTAVADSPSILIPQGATLDYGLERRGLFTKAISVMGTTTGKKFTIIDSKL